MNNRYAVVGLFAAALLATAMFAGRSEGALRIGLWAVAVAEVSVILTLLARRS
ncbi:hypothetical protein [Streptomyces sp. NPDC050600]|uniref:hypothetical protein n=1 Tax=Streptomyces sp. NPDC050600 TaxID=3157213 RepID=UPI00342390A0